MKTYTAIINWNDNDTEEGTFGVTVRANDFEEAERLARQAMRESYIEQYVEEGDDEATVASLLGQHENANGEFGGSLVELSEGAHWLSSRMEEVLRNLIDAYDHEGSLKPSIDAARQIIEEIEKKPD
jgi:predicted RNase H-like HicB family nuclease